MSDNSDRYNVLDDTGLIAAGLNLQAVFTVADLSPDLQGQLADAGIKTGRFPSLILFGNGGPGFWRAYTAANITVENPVDTYSCQVVQDFMVRRFPAVEWQFLYPGPVPVGLQSLGTLAGWHHASPMKVGINDTWGLWYAYRALVAVACELVPSPVVASVSPCETCETRPCLKACPPRALECGELNLDRCLDFRLQPESVCAGQCLARWACPIAPDQRYEAGQVQYHYQHSLSHIRAWKNGQR